MISEIKYLFSVCCQSNALKTPLSLVVAALLFAPFPTQANSEGSVIFFHPDGAGMSHWQAARMFFKGPDGDLYWDMLPHIAVYRGHMSNRITATSNGGATVHAYGVKSPAAGFGSNGKDDKPLTAASGKQESLMHEALRKGIRCGLVNSGSIIEPGTAVFVSSSSTRKNYAKIAKDVIMSGVDIILSGGEEWLLPEGKAGRHTAAGARSDGLDLIQWAKDQGYKVVYDRDELAAVPADTKKLLGVFSEGHTFNDRDAKELTASGTPTYHPTAPTIAQMMDKTLELLGGEQFFLVVEEEGTDNFGNVNNARGTLDALGRADEAFGVAIDFVEKHPDTLLITAADSEAGNMDVIGLPTEPIASSIVAAVAKNGRDPNGAPYDTYLPKSITQSAPDKNGVCFPFVISWGTKHDSSGAILVKATGKNAEDVKGSFDNTEIYALMRKTLFGSAKN